MSIATVKNLLLEMRMQGMFQSLDLSLREATSEKWGHIELLDKLLQDEYEFKEQKKILNKIKMSKLKTHPRFEDFDFTAKRNVTKTQVKDLYSLKWLDDKRSIIIIGPTGVGKTFLAQALGHQACQHKKTTLYMTLSTLLENQMLARSSGSYLKFRDKIARPDVLILDDFGLKKLTATESHDFCELLEERAKSKSTIITTQLPFDHWNEVIEDPVLTDAIIDRLIHTSITIKMTGESYRKIEGQKLENLKVNR